MIQKILFNPLFLLIVKCLDYCTYKISNYLQYCRIKTLFPNAGINLVFDKTTTFKYKENIIIANNVSIGPNVAIGAKSKVVLSDFVRISQNVIIETAGCDLDTNIPYEHKSAPINIEENVWIGSNAIILSGVTIGKNSVIGAGTIVYKDIPENSIVLPPKSEVIKNKRFNKA